METDPPVWLTLLMLLGCFLLIGYMFWDDGLERVWFRWRCKWKGTVVNLPGLGYYPLWQVTDGWSPKGRYTYKLHTLYLADPEDIKRLERHKLLKKLKDG